MDDVEKMAKATNKQRSLFNKNMRSPHSAQVRAASRWPCWMPAAL
jgi:hypothetical protein